MPLAALDVLLVRHAEAVPITAVEADTNDRPLSDAGREAAEELADELEPWSINAVYSSPYPRAVETVTPTAQRRGLTVQVLDDLRERLLSPNALDDWQDHLQRGWTETDYALPGGESGTDAQRRAIAVLNLLRFRHPDGGRLLVGSHGNLISLLLHTLEPRVDFEFHMAMPMPAVYRLSHDGISWRVMGGHGFRSLAEGN